MRQTLRVNQIKLMLTGKFFDLGLADTGTAAIVSPLDKDHFLRAATAKIFSPGATAQMLAKAPLNVSADASIKGLISCPNKIDKPFAHALAAISATRKPWQYWQRYWARL